MARYLRKLRIDDVSSVDQGAGRGVRVLLTKRHEPGEGSMSGSKMLKCPGCGKAHAADDYEAVEKAAPADAETIAKAARMTSDSIIADFRKRMVGASEAAILTAATSSPEYMALHRQERDARLRSQGVL